MPTRSAGATILLHRLNVQHKPPAWRSEWCRWRRSASRGHRHRKLTAATTSRASATTYSTGAPPSIAPTPVARPSSTTLPTTAPPRT